MLTRKTLFLILSAGACNLLVQNAVANENNGDVNAFLDSILDNNSTPQQTTEQPFTPTYTPPPAEQPSITRAPQPVTNGRESLDPLIARMAALKCKQATSALYQKRLLTLLPMIRHGADVDITLPETKGNTALHYSCAIGSLSITRWLLEHGANPNAVTNAGKTPLECVGSDNRAAIIQALKNHGAYTAQPSRPSISSTSDRSSLDPLIARMAALKCKQATSALYQKRLLTLLPMIRHGADVDITLPETKGNTALHYSCAIGSLSITRWLLEHGANPNAITNAGKTPMQCIGSDNRAAISKLLTSYGGQLYPQYH